MTTKLLSILIVALIFLIPLLGATSSYGYEQIKVLFFILSITLIGFIWLISKPRIKWNKINIVSLLFILVLLLTSLFGVDPRISLLGGPPYFQGWIIYAYLWFFSLIVADLKNKLKHWIFILVYLAITVGILVIKDWFLINLFDMQIPTYAGRVASNFGQPNFYAGFLLMVLPLGLSLQNRVGIWGVIISILAILISGSRIAIFLLLPLLVIWFALKTKSKRWIIGGLSGLSLILGIAFYLSVHLSTGVVWQEAVEPFILQSKAFANPLDSVEKRFYIWPLSWKLISQKPFSGWGLENINQAFSNYFSSNQHALFEENLQPSSVLIRLKDLNIDRTHNFSLDLLLSSGIVGLVLWGVLIFLVIEGARKNRVLFFSLILYLTWIQFQNQSIAHLMYFWLFVGVINSRD